MSDLSDDINDALERLKETEGGLHSLMHGDDPPDAISGAALFAHVETAKALRIVFREIAGSDPWPNNQAALDATEHSVMPSINKVVQTAFCSGFLIGQGEAAVVRKQVFYKHLDKLFTLSRFREEVEIFQLTLSQDTAAVQRINQHLYEQATSFAAVSNFANTEVNSAHVWDLWLMVGQSSAITMYLIGLQVG
jgi:hypothetical protein